MKKQAALDLGEFLKGVEMQRHRVLLLFILSVVCLSIFIYYGQPANRVSAAQQADKKPTQSEIYQEFKKASTGNISDAVDEVTGHRGFMYHDMKPIFKAKIIGPAATSILRPVLKTDTTNYPNYQLQILDEAPPGSVIVYVLEDGLETAGIGNLMSATGKVRGLAGAVIDGGARDVDEIEEIGFPVFSRSISPATSVGRYVSVAKQIPVVCAGVLVRPGDYIIGDQTGVVIVPIEKVPQVVQLLRKYDEKESKMIPIIKETKSMLKALEKYNRY